MIYLPKENIPVPFGSRDMKDKTPTCQPNGTNSCEIFSQDQLQSARDISPTETTNFTTCRPPLLKYMSQHHEIKQVDKTHSCFLISCMGGCGLIPSHPKHFEESHRIHVDMVYLPTWKTIKINHSCGYRYTIYQSHGAVMGIRSVSSRVRLKELCSEAFFFAATEEKLRVVPVGLWFLTLGCVEFETPPGQVDTRIPKVERMVSPENGTKRNRRWTELGNNHFLLPAIKLGESITHLSNNITHLSKKSQSTIMRGKIFHHLSWIFRQVVWKCNGCNRKMLDSMGCFFTHKVY